MEHTIIMGHKNYRIDLTGFKNLLGLVVLLLIFI